VGGSGNGSWGLNLASLSTREAAEALQAQLEARGYRTVITPAQVRERQWYRVQILGLPDDAAARALAERFMAETGLKNVWVLRP
jgi:cell division septation protein DedD